MRNKAKSQRRDHLTRASSKAKIELTDEELSTATGGTQRAASLEAGIHLKYDIKAEKEG